MASYSRDQWFSEKRRKFPLVNYFIFVWNNWFDGFGKRNIELPVLYVCLYSEISWCSYIKVSKHLNFLNMITTIRKKINSKCDKCLRTIESKINHFLSKWLTNTIKLRSIWLCNVHLKTTELKICWQQCVDFSIEVLWVSVGQRAAKLWSVKLWRWFCYPGVKPGPPLNSLTLAELQNFFQTSNYDSS